MIFYLDPSTLVNIYSSTQCNSIFPAGLKLEAVWQEIRQEGWNLYSQDVGNNYLQHYDLNLGSEKLDNWTTLPLRLFGRDNRRYLSRCPILAEILSAHGEIRVSGLQSKRETVGHQRTIIYHI